MSKLNRRVTSAPNVHEFRLSVFLACSIHVQSPVSTELLSLVVTTGCAITASFLGIGFKLDNGYVLLSRKDVVDECTD